MTLAPATGEATLARARSGDPEAFGDLVRPHLAMFFKAIDRILGNEAESQDALQDALVALHRELPSFQGQSQFSTWAYRVCINQALMARRKRIRRREDAVEDFQPQFDDTGHHMDQDKVLAWSEAPEALDRVEAAQIRGRVRAALDRLTDDQRAAFVLKDLEGWDTDEIAAKLGITRDLVRQRLHRARLAMRSLLKDLDPTAGTRS
ncbi:MAG TPA: sigma-70 family RNA polymerase sigma factor [Holophagaceae bacterium]|nr:sigma-70 family RNA polymerase sigma factor [Holophagaceae bacterium]